MNTKRQATIILIFAMSLVILGCASGQLLGPTPTPQPTLTPTSNPSLCPGVYLEKAVSKFAVDQPTKITTKLNDDGSVGAETKVTQGNILAIIDLNVFPDSPSIPSSIPGATLRDDPKIGDASAMFDFGGGMFQLQFVQHNVYVIVSFGFIDIFGSRNVDVVVNLAKSIDQVLPSTGLPVQASCNNTLSNLLQFTKAGKRVPTPIPTANSISGQESFRIRNKWNPYCLASIGDSKTIDNQVGMGDCGSSNSIWRWDGQQLRNEWNPYCLASIGDSKALDNRVGMGDCGSSNSIWQWNGEELHNAWNPYCLASIGDSKDIDNPVAMGSCGQSNADWYTEVVP